MEAFTITLALVSIGIASMSIGTSRSTEFTYNLRTLINSSFEKMLYDQAQLLDVYTGLFQATKNPFYEEAGVFEFQ